MAVRFDGSGEEYTATNGLPTNVYTFCCWVRATSLGAGNHVVYWLNASGDVFTGIEFRDTMNDLQAYDSSTYAFNGLGPLAASAGTWYRCALVINGANATFYRAAEGNALGSASVSDFTVSSSPSTWYLGDDPYDEWLDGRLAAVKVWDAALTAAEVEIELGQYLPRRTQNLIRFHPFVVAETVDYSGNSNPLSDGTGTTTEEGPPIPWGASPPGFGAPSASAQSAVLGQPAETDTAQAIARSKVKALGQATETDLAQAATRVRSRALGQPGETDSATAMARTKTRTLGQAAETSSALPVSRTKARGLGQSVETDLAQSVTEGGGVLLGQPTETDTAQPISHSKTKPLGQPAESDAAQAVTRAKARTLGQTAETDTARPIAAAKTKSLGQPSETDTARPVTRVHVITLGQPSEADLARAISEAKTLGQPTEIDLALALTSTGGASSGLAGRIVGLPSAAGSVVQPVTRSLVGSIE